MNAPYRLFDSYEAAIEFRNSLSPTADYEKFVEKRNYHIDKEEESFQRCDTDGFVSQWCDSLSARKNQALAELAKHGGCGVFKVLVDGDDNLVSTKVHGFSSKFHYGKDYKWIVKRPGAVRPEYVTDYKKPENFAKKNLFVKFIVAKGYADIGGSGTGLSGLASCYVFTDLDRRALGLDN